MTDLQALQQQVDAIELADHWPMAGGEQVEAYNPPSYIAEAMSVINLVSDAITEDNIDELVKEDALRVQLLLEQVKQNAAQIVKLLESDYYA